ncbi:hypothetical protein ASA1KI_14950 [Opitutales bacterium ASA1]|uniref:hypothetical protein n=1 Tax=Congregicoccus parvus TaxID=3081749 RepID=UPI002B2A3AD4|nr:hypothetical protein ASA1KI_14950 [Opitutales bacterium ASA1]
MRTLAPDRLEAFARLRRQIDPRCRTDPAAGRDATVATGLPGVDAALSGGLPCGALSELVFSAPSSGGQLFLLHLLHAARRRHCFLALVDGADGFDPQSIEPPELLRQLLWVRCRAPAQAVHAADLLARDANFAMLALDLRGCADRDLRRIPATTWYRLQRVVEPTDTVFAVLGSRRLVPAARIRLRFETPLPLGALAMEQTDVAERLAPGVDRLRTARNWGETATATDVDVATPPTRDAGAPPYPSTHDDEGMLAFAAG